MSQRLGCACTAAYSRTITNAVGIDSTDSATGHIIPTCAGSCTHCVAPSPVVLGALAASACGWRIHTGERPPEKWVNSAGGEGVEQTVVLSSTVPLMHLRILLLIPAGIAFLSASCHRPSSKQTAAAVETSAVEPDAKTRELEQRLRYLEDQERELQRQIDEERLNAESAALAAERDQLQRDREALEKSASEITPQAAAADAPKANPVSEPEPPPSAAPGSDYQLFFDALAGHGTWFEAAEYGCVWQPTVARLESSWRPYTRGRWIDSDQGWTWLSDEPFGWACYHYGRWALLAGRGWIWVPGEVWAPSWVAWRHCDDYIGWCPLPPESGCFDDGVFGASIDDDYGISPECYTFVPAPCFDQPVLDYCVPPAVCVTFFSTTINVTNIIVRPHRVRCHGPKIDWVNRRLKKPMPHYALDCDPRRSPHRERRPHVEGGRVRLFTPEVRAPWNPRLRPAGPVEKLGKVEVVRRTESVKDEGMRRFRQAVQDRRRLADEAVRSGLGQRVIARQNLLSEINEHRAKLGLGTAPAAKAGSGPAVEPPPESRKTDATDARTRLAGIRQEIDRRRGADCATHRRRRKPQSPAGAETPVGNGQRIIAQPGTATVDGSPPRQRNTATQA